MKRFRYVLGLVRDVLEIAVLLAELAIAVQVFMNGAINYRCCTSTPTR